MSQACQQLSLDKESTPYVTINTVIPTRGYIYTIDFLLGCQRPQLFSNGQWRTSCKVLMGLWYYLDDIFTHDGDGKKSGPTFGETGRGPQEVSRGWVAAQGG